MTSITSKIQLRRDTSANWVSSDPVLLSGEVAISTDQLHAGTDQPKFKIGNGTDVWSALDYYPTGSGSSTWGGISGTLSNQTDLQNALNAKQDSLGYTAENSGNKTDVMSGNTASSIKYLSAKGVYDWITGLGYWVSQSATNVVAGIMKLYSTTGSNTDGTMTQDSITTALNAKQNTLTNPVTGTGTNNEIAAFNSTGSSITSLSVATYPSLAELAYVKGVTSAIQTQLDAKKDTFAFLALHGGAPVVTDSSVWYFFNSGIAPTAGNAATDNDYNFGFAVKLIGATVGVYGNTTAGSAENVTIELRNTTQSTTSSIGTFQSNGGSATVTAHFTFTGLNISAGASDYICLKITNPAWATNPVSVNYRVTLFFEKT